MTPKSFILPFLLLSLFWFFILNHLSPPPASPAAKRWRAGISPTSPQILGESLQIDLSGRNAQESAALKVRVRARVGRYRATISGLTSPYAQVTLSGFGLYGETSATLQGRFFFDQALLPETPTELCFQAKDLKGADSSFLCLPKFSANQDLIIKDVYLPPTLTLEKGQIIPGQTRATQGYTTPNSQVAVYLFAQPSFRQIISSVFATSPATPPRLMVQSNESGFFQFNLPSARPGSFRLFVGSTFSQFSSPKSNTLSFKVLSFWERIWRQFLSLLLLLLDLLKKILGNFWVVIISEVVILSFLGAKIFRSWHGEPS